MTKSILTSLVVTLLVLSSISPAVAADQTVTGIASCGKDHETLLTVQAGVKTITYHLVSNDVSKQFHGKICHKAAKATATGEVKVVDGTWRLTASKIELAKK